jgi:dTDP-4-dehydrorhamnose reductase
MRYLVFGGRGMLGSDLTRVFGPGNVTAVGRAEVDITDATTVTALSQGIDVVVNAAAYTQVDDAETHEDEAFAVNAAGAANVASSAASSGARLVHVSTDYVFDGTATEPYREDAPLSPASAYGRSKAEGERLVTRAHPSPLIVRTAWLYGAHGPNFARTILGLADRRDTIDVVTDQLGQPTWTLDLAHAIAALLVAEAPAGIYHGTSSGQASWFDFARAVFDVSGLDPDRIRPTTSATFTRPAPRPAFSVLGHDGWARAGLPPVRPWREALDAAASEGAVAAG